MNSLFSTKKLCRSGIVASLYIALTLIFAPFAYGPFQIRPSEALTILPLFFLDSAPALFIGCLIANIFSPNGPIDIILGSLISLIAAFLTYYIGKIFKNHTLLKVVLGGLPPIVFNALFLPLIWLFTGGEVAYYLNLLSILLTQTIWVYALGIPLYYGILKLQKNNNPLFLK